MSTLMYDQRNLDGLALGTPKTQAFSQPPVTSSQEACLAILQSPHRPSLFVFDLDYTLWPFDCDLDVLAPFSRGPYGGTYDRRGLLSDCYPQVGHILGALVDAGVSVSYASRNPSAGPVEHLLRQSPIASTTLGPGASLWDALPSRALFHAYSRGGLRGKDKHFRAIQEAASGLPFEEMLFFDDLPENVACAEAQGTVSVQIGPSGLTWDALLEGLMRWRALKGWVPA